MRPNNLRKILDGNQPSLSTRLYSTWPSIIEVVGHVGLFDYVEFLSEYSAYDLHDLDAFCRTAELYNLSSMIKIDQEPRKFIAQRAIGSGFQSVLFADCRTKEDVANCVHITRPETPEDGGLFGVAMRRFSYMDYGGTPDYIQALREIVVVIMVEKGAAVDRLEDLLSVKGIDMVQWGPADFSMSTGRSGDRNHSDIKKIEKEMIAKCLAWGIPPRAEINDVESAKYYLDLGIKHFSLSSDLKILYKWWLTNGEKLNTMIKDFWD